MEEAECCQCSRPDLWDLGDCIYCFSCGLAPLGTAIFCVRKAVQIESITDNNEHPSLPSHKGAPFIYKQLEQPTEFRLLRLFPGDPEDDLECEVFHADVSDPPDYEAVSYTWGDTTLACELQTTTGLIRITRNCLSAIKGLRHVMRERILWVDAICIAQADDLEKNHQIPLMSRIFAGAMEVLIYLGDYTTLNNTKRLFSFLSKTRKSPFNTFVGSQIPKLLSLPWFSRIWILQEVAMARRAVIIVGSAALDWNHLSIANIQRLGLKPVDVTGQTPVVLGISQIDKKPIKDLHSMIAMARSCLSSDPRDRFYALLGLLDEKAGIDLTPDYTKSVPEVYTNVATEFLKVYNCLDFLSDVGQSASTFESATGASKAILKTHRKLKLRADEFMTPILQRLLDFLRNLQNNNKDERQFSRRLDYVVFAYDNSLFQFPLIELPWKRLLDYMSPHEIQIFQDHLVQYDNETMGITIDLHCGDSREMRIPVAMEICQEWKERFEVIEHRFLSSAGARVDQAVMQDYGTLLLPEYLFGPIPLPQQKTGTLDNNLDLPSWVPDFRYQPWLSSFARWSPNTFPGQPVARFHAGSAHHPVPSLDVRAIFIDKLQSRDCAPGQIIRLCNESIPVATNSFLGSPADFEDCFRQSLVEMDHGATLDTIRKFSSGRSVALTDMSLAIVPTDFHLGDVIAVLYGGTVPYLLRPRPSEPDRFQLIGECYLHGIKGPRFAPNYAELLGYFKDHVKPVAEESGLGDATDSVLRDGKGNENVGESNPEPRKIHIESTERKDYATPVMEKDTLPWKTIYLV